MTGRVVVNVLRFLLGALLLLVLFAQIFFLPWASADYASWYPEVADMRWPILRLSIAGLVCVQVGIVCTMLLLGLTLDGDVFSRPALRWVDTIIGSFLAGSLVCLLTVFYLSSSVNGPPLLVFMLLLGFVGGFGLALLMWVMRTLLVQATTLRREMEAVI